MDKTSNIKYNTLPKVKISVAVITYNQQETIGHTIESILAQKGDFDLELVIGEDCSSDNTLAICQEYVSRVESQESRVESGKRTIKLLSGPKNLGIMANFARVIKACTGNYISNIAGDDYYCDNHALEKQVQYMQSHPEVGALAANGYNDYVQRDIKIPGLNPVLESGHDTAKEHYFQFTCVEGAYLAPVGMMYRAELLHSYIDFDEMLRRHLPVEDYPIQAILSQHTRFACLPDLLVTYRVYRESATFISYDHPKFLEYYRGLINTRRYLNELFPDDAVPEEQLQELLFHKEFMLYLYQGDYKKAKQLLTAVPKAMANTPKVKQAERFSKTWLHFTAAHYYKLFYYRRNKKVL